MVWKGALETFGANWKGYFASARNEKEGLQGRENANKIGVFCMGERLGRVF